VKHSERIVTWFGDNADAVVRGVPRALARAHAFAADAQAHSGTDKQDPYGHTLKNTQHEQLVAALGVLPGAELFQPKGASYKLVRFPAQRTLVYPWRYAKSLSEPREEARMRVSEFRSDLLGGGVRDRSQLVLDQAHLSDEELAEQLEDDEALMRAVQDLSQVVLVPYVSNERGLLAVGLGAAKLLNGRGDLDWEHYEPLALVEDNQDEYTGASAGGPNRPHLQIVRGGEPGSFDSSPLDDNLGISARPYPEDAPSSEGDGTDSVGTGTEDDASDGPGEQ
jgi:hypothetical protein